MTNDQTSTFKFTALLTETGWISPAYVTLDTLGRINSIDPDPSKTAIENTTSINGYALPGFQNAHSHAFQYAMAGLAEVHPSGKQTDNFWTWRDKMYRIALTMAPDQMEAIAAMLYREMLRHGYTHVAEFHYLHHDKNGKYYTNLAEMGERLVAAAAKAGIRITLIPMFYQNGGFGKTPEQHQKRFISKSIDDYWKLLEASKRAISQYKGASLAFGVHSLRAVHGEALTATFDQGPAELPFHLHIAEQLKEVDDCVAFSGQRPVEYLFNHADVNGRFHLVHATHLADEELLQIANSGAHVVLCPTTEGNLGDGLFRFREYKKLNGKWSIGTDSHIGLNPLEELRLLDYGQRLISHQRDTFIDQSGDSGFYALKQAFLGGRKAMGHQNDQFFTIGQPLDAVVFDVNQPLLAASSFDNLLSTIIYSCDVSMIIGTMINGQWSYDRDNRHDNKLIENFKSTINKIGVRS